ncbi:hypothetical protein BCR39DRAFT_550295 [Naematelia encephala]|uniref:Sas10/Utp3/C1D family-domain-containing protein n=1 Tax=Naematelia encephala TaxID=71784 RepID=A0A1Y2AKA8_9TREE|nr:hypothetical protein BCR39DRAFT_550295 [Naematelia encephala]
MSEVLDAIHTAIEAASAVPVPSAGLENGISLLLLRPQLLLSSLQNLVILLGCQFVSTSSPTPALRSLQGPRNSTNVLDNIAGELLLNAELLDKVRSLESKLDYQIRKLMSLVDTPVEAAEDDPLSFRPNPKTMVTGNAVNRSSESVYRPPRVAAVPFDPKQRKERRAPALLSEFAATVDGLPIVESSSGLSTRPTSRHTNSVSAKRASELHRMNEFEEENFTRLVTTKREAKRRREDEEALALGYGVGGKGRARRQNGLEAELEGVLGERGSGAWDGVSKSLGRQKSRPDAKRRKGDQ